MHNGRAVRQTMRTTEAPSLFRLGGRVCRAAVALAVCFALVALAGCTSRPAPLQDPPAVPSDDATFETGEIEAAMDAMLTAGAPAVLVEVRDGDEVWRHSVGVETVTGDARPDPLAPVRIASVTKSMVGALLMQLVAESEIDLDEPIATYLPDLYLGREVLEVPGSGGAGGDNSSATPAPTDLTLEPSPTPTGPGWTAPNETPPATGVPAGAEVGSDVAFDAEGNPIIDPASVVTPRMLAQHTSGLPDYIGTFPLNDFAELPATLQADYELESLIGRVAAEPWTGVPDAAFSYSNTNYLVLSLLIEAVTGDSIDEALRERIFDSGNLEATSLPTDAKLPEGGAHGYFSHEGVYVDVSTQAGSLFSGAGGVVSTVGDVNSFYRALMQGAYLHADELQTMLDLNDSGYGIGIQGHTDPCGPGEPVYATPPPEAGDEVPGDDPDETTPNSTPPPNAANLADVPQASGGGDDAAPDTSPQPEAGTAPGATNTPAATPTSTTSGTPGATQEAFVEIGEPGMTYGHLGSGLGYRILTMSSPDGLRQVTVSWTASPLDYGADPRLGPAWQAVDAALGATCP